MKNLIGFLLLFIFFFQWATACKIDGPLGGQHHIGPTLEAQPFTEGKWISLMGRLTNRLALPWSVGSLGVVFNESMNWADFRRITFC